MIPSGSADAQLRVLVLITFACIIRVFRGTEHCYVRSSLRLTTNFSKVNEIEAIAALQCLYQNDRNKID